MDIFVFTILSLSRLFTVTIKKPIFQSQIIELEPRPPLKKVAFSGHIILK